MGIKPQAANSAWFIVFLLNTFASQTNTLAGEYVEAGLCEKMLN
jgi:hypothetical protein